MLLKVLLFAYFEVNRSLSKIEHLCKTDIRYLYLSNEERPGKMAFQKLNTSLIRLMIYFLISVNILLMILCYAMKMFNLKNGIELVQKYNMYGKKEDKNFQKRIYNSCNWKSNEKGYRICPAKRVFQYTKDEYKNTINENLSIKQMYCKLMQCNGCDNIKDCTKDSYRKITKDVALEEFQNTVDKNLSTEQGKEMKKQRSIQAEGAFRIIKQDFKFTRFSRKETKNIKTEFLLICLEYNFRKYHIHRMKIKHQ